MVPIMDEYYREARDSVIHKGIVDAFHSLYFYSGAIRETTWLGVTVYQCPLDLWMLQQIIVETRPEVIVETGSAYGGSALFFCSVFDGQVISIDAQEQYRPIVAHERIRFIRGRSTDPDVFEQVLQLTARKRVMVMLDSDHTAENVAAELDIYAPLVSAGCSLVVCDTNVGNPVQSTDTPPPGPGGAVEAFLARDARFERDPAREQFLLTFNPGGWLRRR